MRSTTRWPILLTCCVLASACRDTAGPVGLEGPQAGSPAPDPRALGGRTVAEYHCRVTVADRQVACSETPPSGARRVILGQNQVKLTSSNVVGTDSTRRIFSFDVTVKNLMPDSIGTPDGTRVSGIKVYYETGPSASSYVAGYDTGTVYVANPDGTGNFTRANQPYHFYNQMLAPQQVTPAKNWHLYLGPTVASFAFTLRVFTARVREVPVPTASPDSVPAWVYDESKLIGSGPNLRLRNIARIIFTETATPEERQAAVDAIGGQVVGGLKTLETDGHYFVRIPDDSTGARLSSSLTTLQGLPQVEFSGPEYVVAPGDALTRILPSDGTGWQRADYKLDRNAPSGQNWALEAISAPMGWGCSVGSSGVPIAVVDEGYHSVPDLLANVAYSQKLDAYADEDHGTTVAAVIGAAGNNNQGTSGVMHKAALRLYEVRKIRFLSRLAFARTDEASALSEAIRSGAKVVNISRGLTWKDAQGNPLQPDPQVVTSYHHEFKTVISRLQQRGYRPLLVISAGNNGHLNADQSGLPQLMNDFPERVLVAGAHDVFYLKASFSSGGPLVNIMAPGDMAGGIKGTGVPTDSLTGTSFSAPHVAGVAGLLFAFDSRLTAEDVQQLIIDGAVEGGRLVNGVPVADAYQSLRLAAKYAGAPLCGNPVWQKTDGSVWTLRGAAEEQLFTAALGTVEPYHLGSTVRVGSTYFNRQPDGSWTSGAAPAGLVPNASNYSRVGKTHDGDSTVTVTRRNGTNAITQELWTVYLNGTPVATDIPGPAVNKVGSVSRCVEWDLNGTEWAACYASVNTWTNRVNAFSRVSYAPNGWVILMVYTEKSSYEIGNAYIHNGYWVRDHGLTVQSNSTRIYFINPANGSYTSFDEPNYDLRSMAVSEDGAEVMLEKRNFFSSSTNTPDETFNSSFNVCNAEFRRLTLAAPVTMTSRYSTPIVHNTSNCYAGATFAP
jgi:hypothetical protein